jgi:hypothetical protein
MLDRWDAVFKPRLRSIVSTYLHEILDTRNRWAHEESFSRDDVARAKSTIRLVAEAIGAPSYPRGSTAPAPKRGHNRSGEVKASYKATRLLFKAAIIEALEPSDRFEIVTPDGTFEMSKADFYRVFPNVAKTRSYTETGVYHYPTVPQAALVFLRR